jgi:chromate transport protein ChrA
MARASAPVASDRASELCAGLSPKSRELGQQRLHAVQQREGGEAGQEQREADAGKGHGGVGRHRDGRIGAARQGQDGMGESTRGVVIRPIDEGGGVYLLWIYHRGPGRCGAGAMIQACCRAAGCGVLHGCRDELSVFPVTEGAAAPPAAPAAPTLGQAFAYWLRLGFLSFGGPAGQIALMHEDLVERRRWISEQRFLHALNYCMVLPGPEAQQLATYIGWLMHRSWGGLIAGGLFVLPSLLILIALSWVYMAWGQVPAVAGVLYGIKPAVTAIVVSAAVRIGSRTLKNRWLWGLAAAAFLAIFALGLPFPLIVGLAGVAGYLGGGWRRPSSRWAAATVRSGPRRGRR